MHKKTDIFCALWRTEKIKNSFAFNVDIFKQEVRESFHLQSGREMVQ